MTTKKFPIAPEDVPEFIGQVIDTFEDFLDEKQIIIQNPERDEDLALNPEDSANIYGSDYGFLSTEIRTILENWKLTDKE